MLRLVLEDYLQLAAKRAVGADDGTLAQDLDHGAKRIVAFVTHDLECWHAGAAGCQLESLVGGEDPERLGRPANFGRIDRPCASKIARLHITFDLAVDEKQDACPRILLGAEVREGDGLRAVGVHGLVEKEPEVHRLGLGCRQLGHHAHHPFGDRFGAQVAHRAQNLESGCNIGIRLGQHEEDLGLTQTPAARFSADHAFQRFESVGQRGAVEHGKGGPSRRGQEAEAERLA